MLFRSARKVVVEAIAETMAERTSKERKIIANEFDFFHLSFSDDAGSCDPACSKAVSADTCLHAPILRRQHHLCPVLPASRFTDHYGTTSARKPFPDPEADARLFSDLPALSG